VLSGRNSQRHHARHSPRHGMISCLHVYSRFTDMSIYILSDNEFRFQAHEGLSEVFLVVGKSVADAQQGKLARLGGVVVN
jgi:hypothetical protein